ncbi:MAG: phosphoribosyl transferase [Candidatus Terraquivivens tikiterensis]|uniref:Phosphoribosyl transferase n=1 Tax=Candidatus Terraquivivens tikiterensis TaxID=1980982 RepID=A0A2R7Y3G9_9ARCH|nr:MAG: phosphoribosyl transferase [Candidatus Terraquivivens tikiterensis]
MIFKNRTEAGRLLAKALIEYKGCDVVVLAVPRGGVVIGYYVAEELGCPLDVIVPRKLGAPFQPELAIGAVAEDGTTVLNEDLVNSMGVSEQYIERKVKEEVAEIKRRIALYRSGKEAIPVKDKIVVLVDDGLATGATMRAAVKYVKKLGPRAIVVAVPVAPPETVKSLRQEVDKVVCLYTPEPFYAIGQFYEEFEQVEDEEVIRLLSARRCAA